MRVERMSFHHAEGRHGFYDVTLSLTNKGLASNLGGSSGDPGGFPYVPPPPPPDLSFCCSTTSPSPGIATDIRAEEVYRATIPAAGLGATVRVKVPEWSITDTLPSSGWGTLNLVLSWDGGALQYAAIGADNFGGGFTANACWNGGGLSACSGVEGGSPASPGVVIARPSPTSDEVLRIWGIQGINSTSAPTTFCLTMGAVIDNATGLEVPSEIVVTEPTPPAPAQPVLRETPTPDPDGATTTFTTAWPFADGSLRVFVDNLDQTRAVTSYDGDAGTFELGFAPTATEQIRVDYQGR